MVDARTVQSYCNVCQDVRAHALGDDPGACTCIVCGTVQPLMVPVDS